MIYPDVRMYGTWQEWATALMRVLISGEEGVPTVYFQPCLLANRPAPVQGGLIYIIDSAVYQFSNGTTWANV